jgi:hypothetical protein
MEACICNKRVLDRACFWATGALGQGMVLNCSSVYPKNFAIYGLKEKEEMILQTLDLSLSPVCCP